jgi:hypothetical protein
MGFPVRVHGEVLYLQVDTPRNLWIDRVAELMAKGLVFENVYFADRQDCPEVTFDILNPAHHQWLVSECQARPYLTVIIDTLRETFDGDENDSNQMKRVVAKLVKATAPAALVLISHSRKPSRDQPSGITQNQRGSSYVAGRMDALVEVIEGKLNARSRTMGDTTITVSQGEDCGMFACVESGAGGEGAAQEVVSAFPTLSGREQAKLLQDKLGWEEGDRGLPIAPSQNQGEVLTTKGRGGGPSSHDAFGRKVLLTFTDDVGASYLHRAGPCPATSSWPVQALAAAEAVAEVAGGVHGFGHAEERTGRRSHSSARGPVVASPGDRLPAHPEVVDGQLVAERGEVEGQPQRIGCFRGRQPSTRPARAGVVGRIPQTQVDIPELIRELPPTTTLVNSTAPVWLAPVMSGLVLNPKAEIRLSMVERLSTVRSETTVPLVPEV